MMKVTKFGLSITIAYNEKRKTKEREGEKARKASSSNKPINMGRKR